MKHYTTHFVKTLLLCSFLFTLKANAQTGCDLEVCQLGNNLVSNPSFEAYTSCPVSYSEMSSCTGWSQSGFNGSSDYMNACAVDFSNIDVPNNIFGSQLAATGNGYGGFYTYVDFGTGPGQNYREYARTQLSAPLEIGETYLIQMQVSLADNSYYATTSLGVYFSTLTPTVEAPNDVNPQVVFTQYVDDATGWTTVCALFTPTQPYQWIVIGSFDNDFETTYTQVSTNNVEGLNTAYYYIDDVVVAKNLSNSITPPDLQANFTYQQITSCPFPMVSFVNTSTDTTDNTTILWQFGDGNTNTNYNPGDYIYFAGGTYTVSLILTDNTACYSTADTMTMVIDVADCDPCAGVVPPIVTAAFAPSVTQGCVPLSVSFANNSTNATQYSWNLGNGQTSTAQTPPNQIYDPIGSYTITLVARDSTQCYDVSATATANVTVDGCDPCEGIVTPIVTAAFAPSITQGCVPLSVSFTNNSTNATQYSWDLGNGQTSTAQTPATQTYTAGSYDIVLIARDSTQCYDVSATATQTIGVQICDTTIVLFPNAFAPNNNSTNETFRPFASQPFSQYSMQIYNRWGQKVFDTADTNEGWDGKYKGTPQPMGVYVWQCKYTLLEENESKTQKGNVTLLR